MDSIEIKEFFKTKDMTLISFENSKQKYGLRIKVGKTVEFINFRTRKVATQKDVEKLLYLAETFRTDLFKKIYDLDYSIEEYKKLRKREQVLAAREKKGRYDQLTTGYAFVTYARETKKGVNCHGYITKLNIDSTKSIRKFFSVSKVIGHSENTAFANACKHIDTLVGLKHLTKPEYLKLKKKLIW